MKKLVVSILCLLTTTMVYSQDVIITKDGDALKVYDLEVSSNSVYFRENEDSGSAIKRMQKADLLMIKYKDGKKEIIGEENNSATQQKQEVQMANGQFAITQDNLNPEIQALNLKQIQAFNNISPIYIGNDTLKEWKSDGMCFILGVKENSIIETPELSVTFKGVNWVAEHSFSKGILKWERIIGMDEEAPSTTDSRVNKIVITLRNKTNNTLFVDLGNSFVMTVSKTTPFYIPTAQTSVSGTSSGVGVNLGAVTGALGVGGAAGTLASGVTVGGGNMSQNSTTTFSQRVISIPPMSSRSLDPMDIGEGQIFNGFNNGAIQGNHDIVKHIIPTLIDKNYAEMVDDIPTMKSFKRGYKINLEPISESPLSAFFTYSTNEQFSSTYTFKIDFYVRQIVLYTNFKKQIDAKNCPLRFNQLSTKGIRKKFKVLD